MSLIEWDSVPFVNRYRSGIAIGGLVEVAVFPDCNLWAWHVKRSETRGSGYASEAEAQAAADQHLGDILRSAGWIPAPETTPVNAERHAVRFAAVDLPAEVNHDRVQIEALGRRLTEEESLTALGRWMVGEGEHPLIKPAE